MTKVFGNKFVVLGLSLGSAVFMYLRIVVPLLPENHDDVAFVEFPEAADEFASADISADVEEAQPRLKLATAQYSLRNIDVATLQFNENPRRDPFIDTPIKAAPLAAVKVKPTASKAPRSVASKVVLPVLTAVVHSADQSAAVIDQRIVRAGDQIGLFKVQTIRRDHVVLAAVTSNRSFKLSVTP